MLALIIIAAVLGVAALGVGVYLSIKSMKKMTTPLAEYRKDFFIRLGVSGAAVIFFLLTFVFLALRNQLDLGLHTLDVVEWLFLILGGLLAFAGLSMILQLYFDRYKNPNTPKSYQKPFTYVYYIAFAALLFGTIFMLDGFAEQLSYPMISGFAIGGSPFFTTPANQGTAGGFHVAFYGVAIVSGVILVYIVGDRKMFAKYGEHGILDSTLFAGVIPGIIGARLWYCISTQMPINQWFDLVSLRQGGLAVQGGVVLGILCGAIWFLFMKRKYSLFYTIDAVVPLILLAQAVGRWGNFFNQEVYGDPISEFHWIWNIVPRFVKNNMYIGGKYVTPLFLIESVLNIFGYFVIVKAIKMPLEKNGLWVGGNAGAAYFIWYGTVRILMEPLRNGQYIMGDDRGVQVSVITSGVFILAGVTLMLANYLVRFIMTSVVNKTLATYKYKGLICDWDGTLVNSDYMLWNTFKILYNKYKPGQEITFEKAQSFSGPPMSDTLLTEFPDLDQKKLLEEYLKISSIRGSDVILYPSAKKTLRALRYKGIKLALVTNKNRAGVIEQLKLFKLEHYFTAIIGNEDVVNPKPAPDGLLLAAEKLGLSIEDVMFIGDSTYDYESSKNANIHCALVSWSPRIDPNWSKDYSLITSLEDVSGVMRGE